MPRRPDRRGDPVRNASPLAGTKEQLGGGHDASETFVRRRAFLSFGGAAGWMPACITMSGCCARYGSGRCRADRTLSPVLWVSRNWVRTLFRGGGRSRPRMSGYWVRVVFFFFFFFCGSASMSRSAQMGLVGGCGRPRPSYRVRPRSVRGRGRCPQPDPACASPGASRAGCAARGGAAHRPRRGHPSAGPAPAGSSGRR